MDFFYPNFTNDMWRIFGLVFFHDATTFTNAGARRFDKEKIITFLQTVGIALYDTACAVRRLHGNASDKYLEVAEITDVVALIRRMPQCKAIITTGQKATEVLADVLKSVQPKVGSFVEITVENRPLRFYRMPSSSRAYPLKIEKKAQVYSQMFQDLGLLR